MQLENIQRVRQGHGGCTSDHRQLCIHALLNLLDGTTSTSNSCNMGTRDLPDMYAQNQRAYISGRS